MTEKTIDFGAKILKGTPFGARVLGTRVEIMIGDRVRSMDYETALRLGAILYHCGKHAKRLAGDHSRRVLGLAYLTDANADELELQKSRDATAVYGSSSRIS